MPDSSEKKVRDTEIPAFERFVISLTNDSHPDWVRNIGRSLLFVMIFFNFKLVTLEHITGDMQDRIKVNVVENLANHFCEKYGNTRDIRAITFDFYDQEFGLSVLRREEDHFAQRGIVLTWSKQVHWAKQVMQESNKHSKEEILEAQEILILQKNLAELFLEYPK